MPIHPSNAGEQFIRVYRGLQSVTPEEVNTDRVGPHWTTDQETAENFATTDPETGYPHMQSGTVLSGRVDAAHVIQRGTREHDDWMNRFHVLAEDIENEVTVRPGSPVLVDGYSFFGETESDDRNESHPEPREYRA